MPNFIEDPYEEMVDDYILKSISDILKSPSDDLRKHIRYYERDLKDGKKLVLIGHSQGNFYANEAYDYLQSDDVGVVAVATPADRVGKDVIGYLIYKNGKPITEIPIKTYYFIDNQYKNGDTYEIIAIDKAGNRSKPLKIKE